LALALWSWSWLNLVFDDAGAGSSHLVAAMHGLDPCRCKVCGREKERDEREEREKEREKE
jgi:hypothetical protein